MAKLYTIKFSEGTIPTQGENQEVTNEPKAQFERKMMSTLMALATNEMKEPKEMLAGYDFMDEIDNLKEEKEIQITERDLDSLEAGIKASVNRRHPSWNLAKDLFRQIIKPVEYVKPYFW